ncbi:MAG: DUF427 domain-containing protein [Pseudomonadota bacterium]
MWSFRGQSRPDFAATPDAGQESVWDYPRPPALVGCSRAIRVESGGAVIASTCRSFRVLETASPPTFYLPPSSVDASLLVAAGGSSFCEWKGAATYFTLASDPDTPVAWCYPHPSPAFSEIRNYLSFYPGRVACFVDDERVRPQAGGFYGGWITADVVGPFKGDPGTQGW